MNDNPRLEHNVFLKEVSDSTQSKTEGSLTEVGTHTNLNSNSPFVYSRSELLSLRDTASSYVYTRPEELEALYCRDEPGNIFTAYKLGITMDGKEQDVKNFRPKNVNLMRNPNNSTRERMDRERFEREKRIVLNREGSQSNPGVSGSTVAWTTKSQADYSNPQQQRRRFVHHSPYDIPKEEEQESPSIILSPPRKMFPSSQISQVPPKRGTSNGAPQQLQPPPGFKSTASHPSQTNDRVYNNKRLNAFPSRDTDNNHSKVRYQQKKHSDHPEAAHKESPMPYNVDNLFAPTEGEETKSYTWDDFITQFTVPEPVEEGATVTEESSSSRGFARWFALEQSEGQHADERDEYNHEEQEREQESVSVDKQSETVPTVPRTEVPAPMSQANDSNEVSGKVNQVMTTNIGEQAQTVQMKSISLQQLLSQVPTPAPVDPQKESESASFITSLLTKTSLQERNALQPNPYMNPYPFVPQGMPPPHTTAASSTDGRPRLPPNFYPMAPPHHPPPHNFVPPPFTMQPLAPSGQDTAVYRGPPPHRQFPMNMPLFPNQNFPPLAKPTPFPQQQQQQLPQQHPQSEAEKASLEKWFGAAVYQNSPPQMANIKVVSVEEIEKSFARTK